MWAGCRKQGNMTEVDTVRSTNENSYWKRGVCFCYWVWQLLHFQCVQYIIHFVQVCYTLFNPKLVCMSFFSCTMDKPTNKTPNDPFSTASRVCLSALNEDTNNCEEWGHHLPLQSAHARACTQSQGRKSELLDSVQTGKMDLSRSSQGWCSSKSARASAWDAVNDKCVFLKLSCSAFTLSPLWAVQTPSVSSLTALWRVSLQHLCSERHDGK